MHAYGILVECIEFIPFLDPQILHLCCFLNSHSQKLK